MKPFENRARQTATRLIAKYGQAVTWRQVRDGAPGDGSKPWKPGESVTTDFPVTICFLPSDRKDLRFLMYMTGSQVPDAYETALMSGVLPFDPALKDLIVRDTKIITPAWLEAFNPAGNPIYWLMGLNP